MFMPLVGELLMSTPKVSHWGTGDSPENAHPNSPLEGEGLCVSVLRAEVRNKTGGVSIQYAIFCFVWCMTSPNPRTLSPGTKPLVLPVGIEAADQWGEVRPHGGDMGSRNIIGS